MDNLLNHLYVLLDKIVEQLIILVPVAGGLLLIWLQQRWNHQAAIRAVEAAKLQAAKDAAATKEAVAENTDLTAKATAVVVQTAEADGGKNTPVVAEAKQAIYDSKIGSSVHCLPDNKEICK